MNSSLLKVKLLNLFKNKYDLDLLASILLARLGLLGNLEWDMEVSFIISTGRTGTKFLAKLLNKIDLVEARHEPSPDFLITGLKYAKGDTSTRKAMNKIGTDRDGLLRLLKKENVNHYIESNNRLFSLISTLIRDAFYCKTS